MQQRQQPQQLYSTNCYNQETHAKKNLTHWVFFTRLFRYVSLLSLSHCQFEESCTIFYANINFIHSENEYADRCDGWLGDLLVATSAKCQLQKQNQNQKEKKQPIALRSKWHRWKTTRSLPLFLGLKWMNIIDILICRSVRFHVNVYDIYVRSLYGRVTHMSILFSCNLTSFCILISSGCCHIGLSYISIHA